MSAKQKIVVLHMKELVYTVIFVVLAVLLILLFCFLCSVRKKDESAKDHEVYTGKYTSSILFNDNSIDVEVVVMRTGSTVSLVNLDESVATMYPLMQPALDAISQQIYENQSLEGIDYGSENQYTSQVLVEGSGMPCQKQRKSDKIGTIKMRELRWTADVKIFPIRLFIRR